jgi:AraC-like DNA-binding protein
MSKTIEPSIPTLKNIRERSSSSDEPARNSNFLSPEHDRLYEHVTPIADASTGNDPLSEAVQLVSETAVIVHKQAIEDSAKLQHVTLNVRQEIYHRLLLAKDEIDANYTKNLTVEYLARISCLSHYHFLRLFKQVFSITPHQYIIRKRLDCACRMLIESDVSIREISMKVGFESHGSFTTLFKRIYGAPPGEFRHTMQKK